MIHKYSYINNIYILFTNACIKAHKICTYVHAYITMIANIYL